MDNYFEDFKKKEQLLIQRLDHIQKLYVSDFKNQTDETSLNIQKSSNELEPSIILYNDYFRKMMSKLMAVSVDKNKLYDMCNYVIEINKKYLSTTQADVKTLKLKFDEICKYDSKSEESSRYYDDPLFCTYVASKTFKKTAVEVFEFLYYAFDKEEYLGKNEYLCSLDITDSILHDNPELARRSFNTFAEFSTINMCKIACENTQDWMKNEIKIASIGGGPGNDCLAIYTYLLSFHSARLVKNPNCYIEVYDLNHNGWMQSHQKTLESFFKGKVNIKWEYTDHQKEFNLDHLHADFISICWTLNENLAFNYDYWDQLVRNNMNAIYVVVEGEQKNVDLLVNIFEKYEFKYVYYESTANPRKVIAHY